MFRSISSHASVAALVAATVVGSASPAQAFNDEANGHVSWFNTAENHTVIFVHGRSDQNHSAQRMIIDNTSLVHPCRHPSLNAWQQYRCAARQDANNYWNSVGTPLTPGQLYSYFYTPEIRDMAAAYDYRNIAGPCNGVYFGASTCSPRGLDGSERVVVTSTNYNQSRFNYPGWVQRTGGALEPANYQNTYLRNAAFVGYYGDSDPTVWTHVGLDGKPNDYLIKNSGPPAQAAIDRAMWEYCSNGRAEYTGEKPWRSCTLVCHSAGCLAVGMYLANGWGPGSPYHNDRDPSDPLFAMSGLNEVFAFNSAAGGTRIAELNDGRMGGLFEPQTPMTNALQRTAALNKYVHGQQLGGYRWVPTYYLAADNRLKDFNKHNMNRFFSDDFFFQEWDNTTPNDGAVTGRSQCGGSGSKDVANGDESGTTQGRSCAYFEAEAGRQYGEVWYNLMEWCRSHTWSCRYDKNLDSVSWKSSCGYDENKKMCNQNHSSLPRLGVQVMSDLW